MALFDYGSGNLHSVGRALIEAGASVVGTSSIHEAAECDGIVIPGVGAFSSCMAGIRAARGDELIALAVAREQPLFGICVGHQILFASGTEHGVETPGMNVYPGRVVRLDARRLPHMGWNRVWVSAPGSVLDVVDGQSCYFVHS
ncbi:MAG: imidazole glycerol phosphate synthase subunit HisH, partial [Propionibacteriales bacterium]